MTASAPGLAPVVLLAAVLADGAGPPEARPGQVLGYGTPSVESYGPASDALTLAYLQARCRAVPDTAVPPRPQTREAACDQFADR